MKSIYLLPVVLHGLLVLADPYIVTEYIVTSVDTYGGYTESGWTTERPSTYTYTEEVVPKSTPFDVISTVTSDSIYEHVTIVELVIPASEATYVPDTTYNSNALETNYVVQVTYTPSASCTQTWAFTTNIPVYIPAIVAPQINPTAFTTTVSAYSAVHLTPVFYTTVLALLNPTDIDPEDLASAMSEYGPSYLNYCYSPTSYCVTTTVVASATSATTSCTTYFNSPDSSYYYDDYEDSWYRQMLIIAITIPVGWFLIWVLLGMLENWLSFKGLMLGQQRKRGLPYAWCCLSFLFLCWTGPTYKAKGVEEQALLKEKWDTYGAGQKFKLWMKWGWRWKYPGPDVCGDEPEIAKRPFRQGCL